MKRAKEFCYVPPGRNYASPSQGYPLAGTHLYTSVKRDKWRQGPCLSRKQRDGWGLSPRPPDSEFEVLAPLPLTPPLGSPKYLFPDSDILAREMIKYSRTELLDEILWHPIVILLYTITVPRNTHPVWHCPQKTYSALANYRLANYLLEENWQISPVGCAYFQNQL